MAFSTTSELAVYVERELGHQLTGASSQRGDILSHLDRAHKIVLGGGGILNYTVDGRRLRDDVTFAFARSQNPKVITLRPVLDDPTIMINRESTSGTLSAAPDGANSVQGYFIRINGEDEVYRIATHTGGSADITLDAGYVGPANVTAANVKIFKLHYTVGSGDVLQLLSPARVFSRESNDDKISIVDKDELLSQWPLYNVDQASPIMAAIVKESSGNVTIQTSSYPRDLERVEVDYIPIPTTLDTTSSDPIVPPQFRLVLAELAIYLMCVRNDDARAGAHLSIARDMFAELVEWNERLMTSGDPDFGRVKLVGPRVGRRLRVQRGYDIAG